MPKTISYALTAPLAAVALSSNVVSVLAFEGFKSVDKSSSNVNVDPGRSAWILLSAKAMDNSPAFSEEDWSGRPIGVAMALADTSTRLSLGLDGQVILWIPLDTANTRM